MASPRPYSPPITRARRAREAASSDRLPTDVLFNILLRFPARDLCRLRAVCRSWLSVTSDPVFITAHAAGHPGPLFLAQFRDDKTHSIYIVDLSDGETFVGDQEYFEDQQEFSEQDDEVGEPAEKC